jgi:mannose-6-phosphate isomerase-like protein (cupin superfamily)
MEYKRPWGYFKILYETPIYKVKEIVVKPLSRLSLQSHKHRCEHWICIKGNGIAIKESETIQLQPDTQVFIDFYNIHRLINTSNEKDLVIIEIQHGTYLGEDDIYRYEDDYNRINYNPRI